MCSLGVPLLFEVREEAEAGSVFCVSSRTNGVVATAAQRWAVDRGRSQGPVRGVDAARRGHYRQPRKD